MEMSRPKLKDLKDLHKCANDLLLSSMVQQDYHYTSSSLQNMSETILKILDLCGSARDVLLTAKEQLQHLHSAARRAVVDQDSSKFEAQVSTHNLQRKKLKKETARCLRSLKKMKKCDNYFFTSDLSLIDSNLIVAVHVLREVRVVTVCIVESLYQGLQLQQRSSSLATRISQRLFAKWESAAAWTQTVLLEAGEPNPLQDLEVVLDCITRRLIHTRALLLNIPNS